jgi:K+-sensing histidine kinase KdpD
MLKNKAISESENVILNQYINELSDQINQSNELLENLLSWSRTELNITTSVFEDILLLDLIETMQKEFSIKLKEKQLQLKIIGDKSTCINKPKQVMLILLRNGLSNAIKFSHAGQDIYIDFNTKSCKIIDNGIGVNTSIKSTLLTQKVYSNFGTNGESGYGMGLYLCNELATKYAITLTIEPNNTGIGTCFCLNF